MGRGNDTKTSKFISLILRHKPEVIGIKLDEHGWADVGELLSGLNASGHPLDREGLARIVREDEKQRYSFSGDKTKIRANQGHSVNVDVELSEQLPPEYLWHGTSERFLGNIFAEGLKPQGRLYVHLSADERTAFTVGARHGKPAVLRVRSGDMSRAGVAFYRSENGVWLVKSVPAEFLELVPDEKTTAP